VVVAMFGWIALSAMVVAPTASAEFGIKSWQAGTCKSFDTSAADFCTYSSPPAEFFHQAAGHPGGGGTDFTVNNDPIAGPDGPLSRVRVDLPEGLNVNPQATPQCPKATFEANPADCAASEVGTSYVVAISELLSPAPLPFPVYNLEPDPGRPALFGFNANLLGVFDLGDVYLQADIDWSGDFHEGFTIDVPAFPPLVRNRLVFEGTKGNSFITLPSPCNGDTVTKLTLTSSDGETDTQTTTPAVIPGDPVSKVVPIDGCEKVPFNPSLAASAGAVTDSPQPVSVTLRVPQSGPDNAMEINSSTVKRAAVSMPVGLGLNPAAAPVLEACKDAQFPDGEGQRGPITCPPKSQIGTVSIQTPVLPKDSLPGRVFLAEQQSRDPESGNLYRVFINAVSTRYGVDVRLRGNVIADSRTGRLTAVVADAPQVTFSEFTLNFAGGEQGPLTSPPICGPNPTASSIDPWSGNAPAMPSGPVQLTTAPGGGPCANTMAERPFGPGFAAAPGTNQVKTHTNFAAFFTRPQGQQELKLVNITLPVGATAKLKGVPYCKPAEIAAAQARSGVAERQNPSCDPQSKVGVATVTAGTGSTPLRIDGGVYLAGPYQGAPLSLVVVTPAVAGPFDLGNVVVRVALNLGAETARINPVAVVPDVFGGAKLDIRSIFVNVNRKEFGLTGTNCRKGETAGILGGGGADPANPAAFSAFPVSAPYRGNGCRKLKFKPRLNLRMFGGTFRNKNPRLRAALRTRGRDANIRRASVALPRAVILDQANLANICTRPQFAAGKCPKKSIYGKARAFTPLLAKPLEGPVYLRSSDNTLPDLVANLRGQVTIDLVGRIDSFRGGIRTTFDRVPDVPVTKFVLTLPGGKRGLLVNSKNLCAKPVRAIVRMKAQNSRKANKKPIVRTPCGKKKKNKGR
jgi:hypothetical protein